MAYFNYDPFGNKALVLKFECPECKHQVTSEEIAIPQPNYLADTASDSQVDNDGYAVCDNCGEEFDISIHSSYGGGDGYINNIHDDWKIEVIEYPDYYDDLYEAIDIFKEEIYNLKKLNEIKLDSSLEKTLKRQLYIGVITSMETYLSDAFINTALSSEHFMEKFVRTFNEFREISIKLNKLFEYNGKIEDIRKSICKESMLDVNYHNLRKVKRMYKGTLDIDLGNTEMLYKAVLTRHILVHRNGKPKDEDKDEVIIDSDVINNLIKETESFISNIDEQIKQKKLTEAINELQLNC